MDQTDRAPNPYRRLLTISIAAATFSHSYDGSVLAFVLGAILADLGGTEAEASISMNDATFRAAIPSIH